MAFALKVVPENKMIFGRAVYNLGHFGDAHVQTLPFLSYFILNGYRCVTDELDLPEFIRSRARMVNRQLMPIHRQFRQIIAFVSISQIARL